MAGKRAREAPAAAQQPAAAGKKRARAAKDAGPAQDKDAAAAKPGKNKAQKALAGLDELFQDASAKVKEEKAKKIKAEEKAKKQEEEELEMRRQWKKEAENGFAANDAKPVRFDKELGMSIYTEESLRINQGGDTADCPFDCDCCY